MVSIRISGPLFEAGAVQGALDRATQATLDFGVGAIARITPVRTGYLAAGWEHNSQNTIYNEVPYCRWVDEGTRRMQGRGMTTRSIPVIGRFFEGAIATEIERLS